MKNFIVLFACITTGFAACKKNTTTPPAGTDAYADFLKNTYWVGTLDRSGYQYAPPCCLKFKADKSIVMYAPFYFNINGTIAAKDSITGTISGIDNLPDGRTSIKTNFTFLNEVTLYITNRKTLTSSSANPAKPVPFQLELFPAAGISVKGTAWSGPLMTAPGPTRGSYAYPDLSSIEFRDKVTVYYRNGRGILAQPTPQLPTPDLLEVKYLQYGPMLFMSGYDETVIKIIDYFGVLLPSGDKMMVYSGAFGSRLPNYLQTIPWYGPIGVTPIINKL